MASARVLPLGGATRDEASVRPTSRARARSGRLMAAVPSALTLLTPRQGSKVPAVVSTTLSPPHSCPNLRQPPPGDLRQGELGKPEAGTCPPLPGLSPASRRQPRSSSRPYPHPSGDSQALCDRPVKGVPTSSFRPSCPGFLQCLAPWQASQERAPTSCSGSHCGCQAARLRSPTPPLHARHAPSTLTTPLSTPPLRAPSHCCSPSSQL